MPLEIEVKFPVPDPEALTQRLRAAGFHEETKRTFERNILYDTPDRRLRSRQAILRVRKYGDRWVVTHKCLPQNNDPSARHKHRDETETEIQDGEALGHIFCCRRSISACATRNMRARRRSCPYGSGGKIRRP